MTHRALIDRHGGQRVMPGGSLIGAAGLAGLVYAENLVAYFACWMVLGVAMSASLYDPAFATLGRVFDPAACRALIMQSAAPLLLAYAIERGSDRAALAVIAAFALVALACFALVTRPRSA